jgi:uncharacterized protein YkwD
VFDPYQEWLGIPAGQRPPTYYQLLGIDPAERQQAVIEKAALDRTAVVRRYQLSRPEESTRLQEQIAQALDTLQNYGARKWYDKYLAETATAPAGGKTTPGRKAYPAAKPALPRTGSRKPQVLLAVGVAAGAVLFVVGGLFLLAGNRPEGTPTRMASASRPALAPETATHRETGSTRPANERSRPAESKSVASPAPVDTITAPSEKKDPAGSAPRDKPGEPPAPVPAKPQAAPERVMPPPAKPEPPPVLSKDEQALLDLTNRARAKEKLPPLKPNALLFKAARAHAANMAKKDTAAQNLDGAPVERVAATGYVAVPLWENDAYTARLDVQAAFDFWMRGGGTRDNILSDQYDEIGLGLARTDRGKWFYTQILGSRPKYAESPALRRSEVAPPRERER